MGHFFSSSRSSVEFTMKFLALLFFVGVAQCGLVKREAEAKAESKADAGHYKSVSAPLCTSVPEKQCKQRELVTPKKVCHEEFDEIVDTTYTEHCTEVVTTECKQIAQHTSHSSAVVGQDSKVVATGVGATPERVVSHGPISHTGYASYGSSLYKKREAEAEAEPKADPEADADAATYGYSSGHVKSAPRCSSTPVKTCEQVPHETKRKVAKTLCKQVDDITYVEDCEVVTRTQCTQRSEHVETHSAVVGHDTRVGPSAVVATHHAGTVPSSPVVASYGATSYSTGLGSIRRIGGYGRY